MRRFPPLVLALWLLAGCAGSGILKMPPYERPAPVADRGGNWTIFVERKPFEPDGSRSMCTPDGRLCATLRRADGWALEIAEDGGPARTVASWPALDNVYHYLDAFVFREAGGARPIAIDQHRSHDRPNVFRAAVTTSLLRVVPGAAAATRVLDVPSYGENYLQTCPGPGDCQRIHLLETSLHLDLANRAGPPRFILAAFARMIPGSNAPTARGTEDAACTFRRVFAVDAGSGSYLPDAPLPACDDYLNVDD